MSTRPKRAKSGTYLYYGKRVNQCGTKKTQRKRRTVVRTEVPLESLCSHMRFRDSDGQDPARLAEQGEVDVQLMTPLRRQLGLCVSRSDRNREDFRKHVCAGLPL